MSEEGHAEPIAGDGEDHRRQLAARGLGIDEVASAIEDANVNMPTGAIFGNRTFVVTTNGQLMQASAYGPAIIAYRKSDGTTGFEVSPALSSRFHPEAAVTR